ncbi:type 1 glutamine amidotransferase [Phytohabitans flavus]|uniref:type 1 glutamine amidotransferase n=1 Tax=Phytohabitans flavus TaxID=1076124 RepID=UPI0031E60881
MSTALVIENDPTDDARRLGEWLTEAGLALSVVKPYAGDPLPADLEGFVALVVLGGEQSAYPPRPEWFDGVEALLRKATRNGVPTLAICLGAQLMATAHGGTVERSASGPEIGPALVGRRDAAETDTLFRYVPLAPDVLQWHFDEITELPAGAVLLAASTRYPHQAFRMGERAWALQFHIECDTPMIGDWAESLPEGYDAYEVIAACDAVMVDVEEVWQPFAARFAALALGELSDMRRPLPLLGQ